MLYLRLPFFLLVLGLKNIESLSKMLLEAVGVHVLIVGLLVINLLFGTLLYAELQKHRQLEKLLEQAQRNIEKHRAFWSSLGKEFPTHQTVVKALDLLKTSE